MSKLKRNVLKDIKELKNVSGQEASALFETIKKLNENMLFIQRNQCEVEAYLSLISEKLEVNKDKLKERINEINIELND